MYTYKMTDKLDITFVLNNILDYSKSNPREFTYLGIGTTPHLSVDKLDEKWDQILPVFLLEYIQKTDDSIRVIHIDPSYEGKLNFLHSYFKTGNWRSKVNINFEYDTSDGLHVWRSEDHRIEIIFIFDSFNHNNNWNNKDNDPFFDHYINIVLSNNHKLVVQEFTGFELDRLFKSLYNKSKNKELFKKKILFDVSYGNDCSCMTDLTVHKPVYDKNGDFYNFTLYNDKDFINIIGVNERIDNIIRKYFEKVYRSKVNDIHVDYRRKLKGDNILFNNPRYNNNSKPDEIMMILQDELSQLIKVFQQLKIINEDKMKLINELFSNYFEYDVYKWNQSVLSILN